MVQEFHVLQCFSCQSFQVQQVKKVNRWSCKMCGEKQSLLKEFGRGSGADCRRHVQKLNAMRGAMMEEQEHTWSLWKQVEADGEDEPEEHDQVSQTQVSQTQVSQTQVTQTQVTQTQVSRWNKYLDTPEEAEPEEEEGENVLMDRQQLHGNNMIDRKRKRREGWTDRGGQDSRTPEQSNWSSPMMKPVRPSATTRTTSLNHTSPPSLNRTSLNHTSPPSLNRTSLNHTSPPSLNRTSPLSLRNNSPPSLNHTSPPSLRNNSPPSLNRTSLNHTSPPSLNRTSLNRTSLNHTSLPSLNSTSPPNGKSIDPPSVSTGPVSRWACFLSSDCQVKEEEEEEEPSASGWSQPVGRAAALMTSSVRPCPLLPVSSMFESGEEFSFDNEFLTAERL